LALAVQPSYDPNCYEKASWAQIRNWAACDVYEPGSTMKLFTIAAALEAGVITPTTPFACGPRIKIGNRTISDHDPPRFTRILDPFGILEVSSNVGTVQIGRRMPPRQHYRLLRKFGFGEVTGSQISGEAPGVIPKLPWRPITQATVTFGQGISVTPLQLVTAACAFANGGYAIQPRLIQRVTSPEGKVIEDYPPVNNGRVISEKTAQEVMAMLLRVVETGTGVEAFVPGYNVAGKTGTAQKIRDDGSGYSGNVISSFLGFAPVEHPRLAILTLLDSPQTIHWASSTAAPLFSKVAQGCLQTLRVKPTRPLNEKRPRNIKHETL
jgi:cell division protein FtsI (penicillin-binding protein 3)